MHDIEKTIAMDVAREMWSAGVIYIGPSSVHLLAFAERFLARVDEARNQGHEPNDARLEKWHEEMRLDAFGPKHG